MLLPNFAFDVIYTGNKDLFLTKSLHYNHRHSLKTFVLSLVLVLFVRSFNSASKPLVVGANSIILEHCYKLYLPCNDTIASMVKPKLIHSPLLNVN